MPHPRHVELLVLVEADDLDAVLEIATVDDIAEAWCRYHSDEVRGVDHPDWWAVELLLGREIFGRRDLYRALLVKLVEHAPNDLVVECVGAGPLESFVSDNEHSIRWIETTCAGNPKFQRALAAAGVRLPRASMP